MLPGIRCTMLFGSALPPAHIATFSAASSSVTVSSILAGDFLLLSGYSTAGSITAPGGYTNIATGGTFFTGCKAAAGGETSLSVPGATTVIVSVFRGAALGATNSALATSTTMTFPSLSLQNTNGTSLVACIAMIASTSVGSGVPAGNTARANITAGTQRHYVFDSVTGVPSFAGLTGSLSGSVSHFGQSIEIKPA